ncbi:uncharacterized protein [Ambystoma mexicanum]|uniref:uncharacterized protein n=1 Tax=Ambystoma mexicanum TaxID=8296 RepID=UPI0037E9A7E5
MSDFEWSEEEQSLDLAASFKQVLGSSLMDAVAEGVRPLQERLETLETILSQPKSSTKGDKRTPTEPLNEGHKGRKLALKRKSSDDPRGSYEEAIEKASEVPDAFAKLKEAYLLKQAVPNLTTPTPGEDNIGEDLGSEEELIDEQGSLGDEEVEEEDWTRPSGGKKARKEKHLVENEEDMFDPDSIRNPRSTEWQPSPRVTQYMAGRLRKPLDKEVRQRLRAECPRPDLPGKVAEAPELDPKMLTFVAKTSKDPRKGIDRSWKSCQEKLLDLAGPLAKIMDLAERAKDTGEEVDPEALAGWAQRAVCLLGNANCAIASERRKGLLLKIDSKLSDLSSYEAGEGAQGLLFGETFGKEMGRFVGTFASLEKAQASIRKIFPSRVFGGTGRYRGRAAGRYQGGRRPQNTRAQYWENKSQDTFFPSRGRFPRGRRPRGSGRGQGFTPGEDQKNN